MIDRKIGDKTISFEITIGARLHVLLSIRARWEGDAGKLKNQ